jgi:adenylosuccinate lyase
MKRNLVRFKNARKAIEVGKISGAVGNFANTPVFVEESICKEIGLGIACISTQVLPRDLHIEYINSLSMIATTIEEIAIEIRSLSRTEIHEVQEHFTPGQKGSSAMPHKRNPIASENMCGCARIVRSYISAAYEDNLLWHERDISHSSTERIMLADASTLVDYMLTRYAKVLNALDVFPMRMIKNINLTYGIIYSGRIVSALINKGLSREEAYDHTQPLAIKAYDEEIMFIELLKKDSYITKYLSNEEIDECFNPEYYMKEVDTIYKRVQIGGNTNE